MRTSTILLLVASLVASFVSAFPGIQDPVHGSLLPPELAFGVSEPQAQWFPNFVDHFNPQDTRKFQQRFYENLEFFDPSNENAPVFVFLGGEGALTGRWVSAGVMHDYGKRFGAILLGLEHRYYGESQPTGDLTLDSLQYLTSEQAIEDTITFVRNYVTKTIPWTRKRAIVTFGGSYAGTLSGLIRARHPHLIRGALASSGPFEPEVDFSEFLEAATEGLRIFGGDDCVADVADATKILSEMLNSPASYSALSIGLNTCTPIYNPTKMDKQNFWFLVSDYMAGIVQYNKPNSPSLNLAKMCHRLTVAKNKEGLTGLTNEYMKLFRETKGDCFDWKYSSMISMLSKTHVGTGMMRQWLYQTCTEWGFYQTANSKNQSFAPFGELNLEYFSSVCQDAYSKTFNLNYITEAADRTRDAYGGWYFQATNVAMTNGNIDPWYKLSFVEKCGKRNPSVTIHFSDKTSHCAILYPEQPYDTQSIRVARQEVGDLIEKWVASNY